MHSSKHWKWAGIIGIIILGFLLHYVFSWTNNSRLVGIFVPVNESPWEHLKLGYYSVMIISLADYFQKENNVRNYFLAKFIGVLALEFTILIIFYGYHLFTDENLLLLDISCYIIAAVIGQYITYHFLQLPPISKAGNSFGLAAFLALGIVFGITTYYPPHIPLFKDHNTNSFGINKDK